jgi:hypothetical protein
MDSFFFNHSFKYFALENKTIDVKNRIKKINITQLIDAASEGQASLFVYKIKQ